MKNGADTENISTVRQKFNNLLNKQKRSFSFQDKDGTISETAKFMICLCKQIKMQYAWQNSTTESKRHGN